MWRYNPPRRSKTQSVFPFSVIFICPKNFVVFVLFKLQSVLQVSLTMHSHQMWSKFFTSQDKCKWFLVQHEFALVFQNIKLQKLAKYSFIQFKLYSISHPIYSINPVTVYMSSFLSVLCLHILFLICKLPINNYQALKCIWLSSVRLPPISPKPTVSYHAVEIGGVAAVVTHDPHWLEPHLKWQRSYFHARWKGPQPGTFCSSEKQLSAQKAVRRNPKRKHVSVQQSDQDTTESYRRP